MSAVPTDKTHQNSSSTNLQTTHHTKTTPLVPAKGGQITPPPARFEIKPIDIDATSQTEATLQEIKRMVGEHAADMNISVQNTITRERDREIFQNIRSVQLSIPPRRRLPEVPLMMLLMVLGSVAIVAIALAICLH